MSSGLSSIVSESANSSTISSSTDDSSNEEQREKQLAPEHEKKRKLDATTTNNNDDNKNTQSAVSSSLTMEKKKVKTMTPSSLSSMDTPDVAFCPTVTIGQEEEDPEAIKLEKMTEACRTILGCIGEDPDREGLLKTPSRWAKALLFMSKGYTQSLASVTNEAVFTEEAHKEMVVVRDIDIHSLCEHHMLPFTGKVHIGYIPNGKIIGLSKLARIAEVFARRLQVQERLTAQIADAIVDTIEPLGVAVVVECSHFCMVMRGVQKVGASTITSSVRGVFQKDPRTRSEFFSIIHNRR